MNIKVVTTFDLYEISDTALRTWIAEADSGPRGSNSKRRRVATRVNIHADECRLVSTQKLFVL